jgi:NADP-dependent 3-hydroxy acid dehydrogenase YdfG
MSVAGAAYSASKMGLGAIVDSLNDQEGRSGIAATLVIPAEVRTEIMQTRPTPLTEPELAAMLDPDVVGLVIKNIVELPRHVCINEVVVSSVLNGIYLRDSAYHGPVRATADV